jgi:RNA polymerase sigma factor (sigma-70 family)
MAMAETEAVLLKRFARGGDAAAFAEIIRRHAGLVYGAALRILADVDRASDVSQETFLQLTRDAGTVTGSLSGWLHRVATHKAIDQMRRETSRRRREMEYAAKRPRETTEWKEISPYVDEGLNQLDPELRDILISHFLQGRTTREIAGARGTSQATVSRRIESGVEQLRAGLRRRGVIVAVGALSALLGEKTVAAAPATLLTELGKMALVGGSAAVSTTAAVGGAASSLSTAATGALAVVKTHAVTVAAVAVIGAGAVVTYQQATKPASRQAPTPAARSTTTPDRPARSVSPPAGAQTRPAPSPGRSQAAEEWDALMASAASGTDAPSDETLSPPAFQEGAATAQTQAPAAQTRRRFGGAMMGGFGAMGGSPPPQGDRSRTPPAGQVAPAGYYYAASARDPGPDEGPSKDGEPNDPNDPNDPDEP